MLYPVQVVRSAARVVPSLYPRMIVLWSTYQIRFPKFLSYTLIRHIALLNCEDGCHKHLLFSIYLEIANGFEGMLLSL